MCGADFLKCDFQTIYNVSEVYNILQHIVKLKIIEVFKKLL